MSSDSLSHLTAKAIDFRDRRDWKQFHALKNLAAALSVEASELVELFLWSDQPRLPKAVAEEVGDILYTLLLFCHEAGIDPGRAFLSKLEISERKYPVDKVKGSAKKYTEYQD